MGKKIKCTLLIGTKTKMMQWGVYESIAAAKRYINETGLSCYKKIIRHDINRDKEIAIQGKSQSAV